MTAGIIAFGLFALGVGVDVIRRLFFLRRRPLNGKHVLVTGGSSGIGKELARTLLHKSARVTLLARTESKLKEAADELRSSCAVAGVAVPSIAYVCADIALKEAADELRSSCAVAGVAVPSIAYVCADIAQQAALSEAISQATTVHGSIDVLICNAGSATPGLFLDMPVETFAKQMDVNYLGTLRCIKAVTPSMVQRGDGQVIIVASACAVVSFLGYSSYAPTKFALRGLADALRNELIGFGVSVHIAYPPDTDTPGFALENASKPPETLAMVPADAYPAEQVARRLLANAEAGFYHLFSPDPLQNLLVSAAAGVSPRSYPFIESLLLPVASLVEALAVVWFDHHGRKMAKRYSAETAGVAEGPPAEAKKVQ
eukprot:CAMPEP_0119399696 /NCGR_PEP_ID=MMETSP1334-20130426/141492_1 /TAXON_ID=127549 /ORGANISM="Calcidiscus leptoporus, Strain RCC1130" /LENGTH=371 /DNA_ID=CAMNT_0007423593 /DNA_START=65 /DNA_END=1180 /DNA_ORIENTATION=+